MLRLLMFVVLVIGVGLDHEARAQEYEPDVDSEYFWDGGAVPFVYGSAAIAIGLRLFAKPAKTPRLFPESEGGHDGFENTVPEWTVSLYSVGIAGLIAASPSPSRWHHLKGYGQAVLTTAALTEIAKDVIGRHRPHYEEGMPDNLDQRRSFFSGHASITAASTVYLGLYLSRNLLPKPSLLKTGGLLLLGGVLVGVPYSRVVDHRHSLSDVLTGAAVGTALAVAFYAYQEARFGDEKEAFIEAKRTRFQLVPNLRNPGVALLTRW